MSDSEKPKFFKNMHSVGLNSEKNCFRLVSQGKLAIRGCRDFMSLETSAVNLFLDTSLSASLLWESISVREQIYGSVEQNACPCWILNPMP